MHLSLKRLCCAVAGWDVVALVVSFALRHAKHGAGEVVGAIAWFGLLLGLLVLVVLVLAAAARAVRVRSSIRQVAR
jgi:hypothetical protein